MPGRDRNHRCIGTTIALNKTKMISTHKTTQSLKIEQRIKRKKIILATFFAKYTCVEMASCKRQTYQNEAKNLCAIFVFDLDGECEFIKTKHYSEEICSWCHLSVNQISSYSSSQGGS